MLVTALRLESQQQQKPEKKFNICKSCAAPPLSHSRSTPPPNGFVLYGLMVRKRDLMCVCKNFFAPQAGEL